MIGFTAACAQFAITPLQPRENVQKCVHWIERAVRETSACLIILPETITTGFAPAMPAAELWDVVSGVYRKTHLFPTERKSADGWSTPGTKPVVVETELGSIGLMICYDGDFPELARCEAILGGDQAAARTSAIPASASIPDE